MFWQIVQTIDCFVGVQMRMLLFTLRERTPQGPPGVRCEWKDTVRWMIVSNGVSNGYEIVKLRTVGSWVFDKYTAKWCIVLDSSVFVKIWFARKHFIQKTPKLPNTTEYRSISRFFKVWRIAEKLVLPLRSKWLFWAIVGEKTILELLQQLQV